MSWKNSPPEGVGYTYDYFFLDYVCRLCWGTNGIVELSSVNPKSLENDATIAEKIRECVGIDVTTHSHPKKVCSKCLDEIEIFAEFKRFCQETDRKLSGILQEGPTHKVQEVEKEENLDESIFLRSESDGELSNLAIEESIDDLFNDFPLPCDITGNVDSKPVRKEKKRLPTYCYSCHCNLESVEKLTQHNLESHGIEGNGLFKCFGCDKRFNSSRKRFRHESEACKQLKSGYKCDVCEIFLPKRRLHERHMQAHKKNKEINLPNDIYECKKCMKTLENTECLREHMLIHCKADKKTYVCDTCGRVFTRRDYLYKHKLIHDGRKLQKCPHCDYRATQRSSLIVHIRKHTGERPYACDLCQRRCITSSNLREHRKRHFGIKAFECKLCDKKFGYKLSLEEHMSAVHDRSEMHTCVHCGSSYTRFRGLRRHLLVKHGQKVKKVKEHAVEVQNEAKIHSKAKFEAKIGENDLVVQNTDGAVIAV